MAKFVYFVLVLSLVCLICLPGVSSNVHAFSLSSGIQAADSNAPNQTGANQTVFIPIGVNQTITYLNCGLGSALNFTFTLNSTMHVGIYVWTTLLVNYDLYVKWDRTQPTLTNYDQLSPRSVSGPDYCSKNGLPPGSYYFMVYHRSDWPGVVYDWFNVTIYGYYPVHNVNTGLSYPTIQGAIDANETLSGHTILVDAGTYDENVTVDKAVSLLGGANGTTVVNGGQIGIVASGVNVTGFTVAGSPSSGVWLNDVHNCSIEGNNVTSNSVGIWLDSSSANNVTGNNVTANSYGIYIYPLSNNNNVTGNYFANNQEGVYVDSSSDETLLGNTFVNDGMLFQNSFENSVSANLVNGEPLVYLEGLSDRTVSEAGQVILVNCSRILVENLDLSNTTRGAELWMTNFSNVTGNNITNTNGGIMLGRSTNNRVEGNNIADNHDYGIGILNSSHNVISANTVQANTGTGIEFDNSSNNAVNGNNIYANEIGISLAQGSPYNLVTENDVERNEQGLALYSSNNSIYHNNFANEEQAVTAAGYSNSMDNGYPSGGNYWSDYNGSDVNGGVYQNETGYDWIGDTPYVIDQNNTDRYPLMQPFVAETEEIKMAYRSLLLRYDSLRSDLQTLNFTTNGLLGNITDLQAECSSLNSTLTNMQAEIDSLNSTCGNLQEVLNNLAATFTLTRDNLQDQINALNQTCTSLSQTLAGVQEQLNSLNSTLQASISKLQDQNNAQNSQSNTMKNQLYVLAIVIIILMAATAYLVIKRPRKRLEKEPQVSSAQNSRSDLG